MLTVELPRIVLWYENKVCLYILDSFGPSSQNLRALVNKSTCSAPTHISVGDIPGKIHQLHSLHCAVDCERFALLQDGFRGIHVGVNVLWD